ncbi:MAG: VanZ family protein [Aridibacter sp.]
MKQRKNSIWNSRIFRYVPLILCIGLILFASTPNASSSETSRFIRPLLEFLFPNTPETTLIIYHKAIRKLAHLTEYSVLAFLASRAFWHSSKEFLQKYWYLFALFLVFIVASIDEINQSFDISRTGSVYDVVLDCFGGWSMIWLFFIFYSRLKAA